MKPSSTVLKVLTVIAIVGVLMIVLMRIGSLVDERRGRAAEAARSIEESQAGSQALLGPALEQLCHETWQETARKNNTVVTTTQRRSITIRSTPDLLTIKGNVAMEPRYRGLFKVNSYQAGTTLSATWSPMQPPTAEHAGGRVTCEAPVIAVALTDSRGLRDVAIRVNGQPLTVTPGTPFEKQPKGFQAVVTDREAGNTEPLSAEVTLQLVGTGGLAIAPVGDRNVIDLTSDWPHPSFGGRFLPMKREVREDGFDASWTISALASTAGRDFLGGAPLCAGVSAVGEPGDPRDYVASSADSPCIETFGIAFIDPVNPYSLTDRALKYGLLFIALSFVAVGMVEVLQRLRVHPVQYLLVGSALAVFFLLLLSLSEHLAFGMSYAIASAACVTLLAYYARHILGGWRAGLGFGTGIAGLYGALFLLLQMEQTAMVLGAVLLFLVLAAVMVATRRIDWYGLTRSTATPA